MMNEVVKGLGFYLPRLVGSIVIFIIGIWLIKHLQKMVEKLILKSKLDESLYGFVISSAGIALKLTLVITIASMMGIPMTTFVTILGAASLAIGFALKDSLANIAGGLLILSFHPFTIGDFIEVNGSMGTVKEIQLLFTSFNTPDNRRVYIPNSDMINSKVINFSKESTRRIDIVFSASYKDDIEKVKEKIMDVVMNHTLILNDPIPIVRVISHGTSSIDYITKVWCLKEDYWTVHHDLHEQVKQTFDQAGLSIPYQQYDVHILDNIKEVNY